MRAVTVSRKGAARWESGHPWIFSSDVIDRADAEPGDAVLVTERNGRPLGTAHFSSSSQIALRMLSPKPVETGPEFFRERLQAALAHRKRVLLGSTSYRLVHGEADFLPGLVIDRYGDYFSVQMLDQGMDRATETIADVIDGLFAPAGIVARNDAAVRSHENLPREIRILRGTVPEHVEIELNGLRWSVSLEHGQKTGIYLDQRDNYLAAARWASGKALDCFTSSGGFAMHLGARCSHVEGIDSSGAAILVARANAERNGISNVDFREADVFQVLSTTSKRYGVIVLDPPAFTKTRGKVDSALRGYKEINLRALKLLEPNGILVTCSCSHHVSEADLLETIAAASLDANRTLRVLERRTQAPDHPVLLTVPETHYLKCLIVQAI